MLALKAKVLSTEPLAHDEAKWTKLVKINYADETGTNRTWESAERTTRPASCGIDGVGIVAILRYPPQSASSPSSCPSSSSSLPSPPLSSASSSCSTTPPSGPPPRYGPRIVLQRQYRPPIDAICIEIPAGLVDEGETPSQAALRELREETGYVGHPTRGITLVTPTMFNDPGFCNTNLQMVHVDVDMALPENRDPRPQLEDGEFIETFDVALADLYAECVRWDKEGFAIDARVVTLAEGFELARSFGLS